MGLYITFLNFLYSWRMGRDSNPRWSCPHNGFQDRRNRPLCHPSETVSRRSFKPTVLFAVRTWRCCSPLVRARLRCACLADSYARPSQSTAALTHPKLFPAGLSNLRFCSLFAPDGAAHHSFALDCAALVLLTRMQDRRNRPRLSPIRNFFPPGCLISVAYYTVLTYRCQFICLLYYFLPVFAIMLYYIQTGER